MELTVFYAWQNDTPSQFNRFLIRDMLEGASKSIRNDASVEESPRIDHDTRGVAGTPEITSSIFSKIKRCAVFVADVTFVGSSLAMGPNSERKLLPNPNVMLELGFAAATVGWERIIAVMNEHYGPAEQQIFDLKNRRFPICYTVPPDSPGNIGETKRQLRAALEEAIRLAVRNAYEAVEEIMASLDTATLNLLRRHAEQDVFWREPDEGRGPVLVNRGLDSAFRHLLALRLIRGTWYSERQEYVYQWTYLGAQTLIRLGLRPQPQP
jgi:hypothetical protein